MVLAREDHRETSGWWGMWCGSRGLRSRLAQVLPEYMVSAQYVFLERLPLTPDGKLDRKALPAPDLIRGEGGYVAPRTPTEARLAEIWAAVLQLDRVGVEDNFFELGGIRCWPRSCSLTCEVSSKWRCRSEPSSKPPQ